MKSGDDWSASLMERTQAYVDASNDHDVERIRTMLNDGVTYQSTGVGEHAGADAIVAMNTTFFAANPDVHWKPENFRIVDGGGIEFDFTITIGGADSRGVERVFFDEAGQIVRVEVER